MNMKNILLALCFVFVSASAQKTEYVVVAVIDGARYTETFGHSTHEYIPFLWNRLSSMGTTYSNFYNNETTETNSGHAIITTGTWQHLKNDGSERPHKPTVFEYYRKKTNTAADLCQVVLGKNKLDILSFSDDPAYGEPYRSMVQLASSKSDLEALENFYAVVKEKHPKIIVMNLPEVDTKGHSGKWNDYVQAIRQADSIVYVMWNFIQQDSIYKDKTTLIITNDHGRHSDGVATGFHDHGCDCQGCRHIMLSILGPDTPAGMIDSTTYQLIDIAPTIATLLKFTTAKAEGEVIRSAIPHVGNK